MHCDAIVSYRPTDYSFEPVYCGQVVGIRSYQSGKEPALIVTVGYCAITGHEQNVRRRFAEVDREPPMPEWFHDLFPEDEPKSLEELLADAMPPQDFGSQIVKMTR